MARGTSWWRVIRMAEPREPVASSEEAIAGGELREAVFGWTAVTRRPSSASSI